MAWEATGEGAHTDAVAPLCVSQWTGDLLLRDRRCWRPIGPALWCVRHDLALFRLLLVRLPHASDRRSAWTFVSNTSDTPITGGTQRSRRLPTFDRRFA
jgi:hypothetical protein